MNSINRATSVGSRGQHISQEGSNSLTSINFNETHTTKINSNDESERGSNVGTGGILLVALASSVVTLCISAVVEAKRRHRRLRAEASAFQDKEEGTAEYCSPDALHSVLAHFRDLTVASDATIEHANRRRTQTYYHKAREAHGQTLIRGMAGPRGSYSFYYFLQYHHHLVRLRRREMDRIMVHHNDGGKKSHRTIVIMCDSETSSLLSKTRDDILRPLDYSTDPKTRGVWIPTQNIIAPSDMHVTVATPWWWHTIDPVNDRDLSRNMASRVRQTLVLKMHHPFTIELERIVLLGGKTLVALWRCVGRRTTLAGEILNDRHGAELDPFVRVREEIVRCFTTGTRDGRRVPLTYQEFRVRCNEAAKAKEGNNGCCARGERDEAVILITSPPSKGAIRPVSSSSNSSLDKNGKMERADTIGDKSPGVAAGDGFIHTTLCRLPALDCVCPTDVDLGPVHRLCREASAALAGHRMVVRSYRFLETTGAGGESNPCVDPVYDETIDAPVLLSVDRDTGRVVERNWSETGVVGVGGGEGSARMTVRNGQVSSLRIVEGEDHAEDGNGRGKSGSAATIGPVQNLSRPLMAEELFDAP